MYILFPSLISEKSILSVTQCFRFKIVSTPSSLCPFDPLRNVPIYLQGNFSNRVGACLLLGNRTSYKNLLLFKITFQV